MADQGPPGQRHAFELGHGLPKANQGPIRQRRRRCPSTVPPRRASRDCRLRFDALPATQKPGQRRSVDRFGLAAQPGQRPTLDPAEHLRVAPLDAAGAITRLAPEFASDESPGILEPRQQRLDSPLRQAEARGGVDRRERPAALRVAPQQTLERRRPRLQEVRRQVIGYDRVQAIAVERRVVPRHPHPPGVPIGRRGRGRHARGSRQLDLDGPLLPRQVREPIIRLAGSPRLDLLPGQTAVRRSRS